MTAAKNYSRLCSKCKEEMPHVSAYSRPVQIGLRIWQILIFICSFGMLYPHTFSTDDEFAVKCTKCGTRGMLSYG
jgi:protein-arginine kinase activator protein McsA